MNNETRNVTLSSENERENIMTKQTMKNILKGICQSAQESSLTGKTVDGDLLFIQTYNKLRKKAIEYNWVDDDIVIELDLKNESIFGDEVTKFNIERMDVIGAAAVVFMSSLDE
jgi:hypothetical protein